MSLVINPGQHPTALLQRTGVRVSDEGRFVRLQIGSGSLVMPYARAIALAQLMRLRAKDAKRREGDVGRHWSVLALVDAELELPAEAAPAGPFARRVRVIVNAVRSLLSHGLSVRAARGGMVYLRIGNTEIGLHYEAALQVSQWLRLHARRAKRAAGDRSRIWSSMGTLENLRH